MTAIDFTRSSTSQSFIVATWDSHPPKLWLVSFLAYGWSVTISLEGRLIFLASPGGLDDERAACHAAVREFNETHAHLQGVTFIVKYWEAMPGGIGRPQDRINRHLDGSDFMILLLGDRWGSPPGLDGTYTSGSEEEFRRCIELLADETAHMRDLLVMFKTLDASRLRDPGPQLQKVMKFRDQLEQSKFVMYDTFDSVESLRLSVTRKLTEWTQPLTLRLPVRIQLQSSLTPLIPPIAATQSEALAFAKAHASKGRFMQAEAAFARATENGDPQALADFALFMRRTGRLDRSLLLNEELLSSQVLSAASDPRSVAFRVSALANIGIIHRKRGAITQSRDALLEAIETAKTSELPVNEQLCYSLDNYGFTLLRLDRPDLAIAQFEESYGLRQQFASSKREIAQSIINIGRVALVLGEYKRAEKRFTESIELLQGENDDHLWANSLSGKAEALLRQGSRENVLELLEDARNTNARIHSSDGSSIVHGLLSRLHLGEGDLASAEVEARLCEAESERTNNYSGRGTSAWLLAEISLARGDTTRSSEHLDEAHGFARSANNSLLLGDIAATIDRLQP